MEYHLIWQARDRSWSHGVSPWPLSLQLSWVRTGLKDEDKAVEIWPGPRFGYRVYSRGIESQIQTCDLLDEEARILMETDPAQALEEDLATLWDMFDD